MFAAHSRVILAGINIHLSLPEAMEGKPTVQCHLKASWVLLFLSLLGLLLIAFSPTPPAVKADGTIPQPGITTTATIFLPIVVTVPDPPPVKLGVDFGSNITQSAVISPDFGLAKAMGAEWTRFELPWLKIEPAPGQFDWAPYDAAMNRAEALGTKVLAVLHSAPTWAAVESCGPISDTVALTTFVTAAVTRYHQVVGAWEFINEPDAKAFVPNYSPTVGCWGPAPDQYAQQLALFYNTVKALDPKALVLFGSLAYDNWAVFDRQFLDNALAQGAGPYFDGLGIHYYPINPVEFPSMRDKIKEVRAILDKYRLWNKQLWVTETSTWTNAGESLEGQKDYIVREQTRGLCNGADNLFWFAVRQEGENPPRHRWLINLAHQPDQGYFTYQHYASQVKGRTCRGAYAQVPANIEAYRLVHVGQPDLYVLWSMTTDTTVTLPATVAARLINRDGAEQQSLTAQNGVVTVTIGRQPSFVVTDPN